MKAKFLRSSVALLAFAVTISVGAGVSKAQYGGGGKDTPAQPAPPPPGTPPAPRGAGKPAPGNKAGETAEKTPYSAPTRNPGNQISLFEKLHKKIPPNH